MWRQAGFPDFPGLDLVSSPDQSPCLDTLNCDLDVHGAVRSRDGYETFSTATTGVQGPASAFYTGSTRQLVVWDNANDLRAINSSGASIATHTTPTNSGTSFARFGTPTAERLYIAGGVVGAGGDMTRWDGSAFTTLTTPDAQPRFLAVQRNDNRLVAVRQTATSGSFVASPSRVYFSDAGDPETFDAANFVDLHPGDGEEITGACSWQNLVFVFKKTKFFVFYGSSVDGTGGAVFNYRTEDMDSAAGLTNIVPCVAAREGVYFASDRGVFRTTGGVPMPVASGLRPIFEADPGPFWQGDNFLVPICMTVIANRLYIACNSNDGLGKLLKLDTLTDQWVYWELAHGPVWLTTFRDAAQVEGLVSVDRTSGGDLRLFSSSATDDAGTAITSRYRTGFYDLGSEGDKRIAQSVLWGTGTVTYALSKDFGALNTGAGAVDDVAGQATVTLGTAPAVARGRASVAANGMLFSHQLSGTGPWRVHRLHHEVSGDMATGSKR